jgi:hypothetical protein
VGRGQRREVERPRVGVKPTSAEEYKQIGSFQAVRKTLLQDRFRDRLERPLVFWAMANDRRLPLAFLGRTVGELVGTPFDELAATPGIGQKKIGTLIKLLTRAIKEQSPAGLDGSPELQADKVDPSSDGSACGRFDPAQVSEALWEQWRATVVRFGVDCEKLGRLVPTLQALPTVIWHTRLEKYCEHTVAEIRRLKTHGEKRVRTILEVFCSVHELLAHASPPEHMSVRMLPKFVNPIECWVDQMIEEEELASIVRDDVRQSLAIPLIQQVEVDAGSTVARLAESRLGINGEPQTVRQQSRRMGVTRARVYQLLEDCNKVMAVRWPEGRFHLRILRAHLKAPEAEVGALGLVRGVIDLFFPGDEDTADRPLRNGDG